MKDEQIEQSLRARPEVAVPPWLHARLRSQIAIDRQGAVALAQIQSVWRRWFPAWSLALLMVCCLVVVAVQTNQLMQTRSANRAIEQQLASQQAPGEGTGAATVDASADFAARVVEAEKLRAEIEQLQGQLFEARQLMSENDSLRTQLATASGQAMAEDPFAAQKAKAERVRCINNIKQIALASRFFLKDNGDIYAPSLQAMQKQLKTPALLVCPSDTGNLPAAQSWDVFEPTRVSYEWLAANHPEGSYEEVIVRCRVHANAGLADGSAQQFNPATVELVTEDGIVKMRRKAAPTPSYE